MRVRNAELLHFTSSALQREPHMGLFSTHSTHIYIYIYIYIVTNQVYELPFTHHQRSLAHLIDSCTTLTVARHPRTTITIIHCTDDTHTADCTNHTPYLNHGLPQSEHRVLYSVYHSPSDSYSTVPCLALPSCLAFLPCLALPCLLALPSCLAFLPCLLALPCLGLCLALAFALPCLALPCLALPCLCFAFPGLARVSWINSVIVLCIMYYV